MRNQKETMIISSNQIQRHKEILSVKNKQILNVKSIFAKLATGQHGIH